MAPPPASPAVVPGSVPLLRAVPPAALIASERAKQAADNEAYLASQPNAYDNFLAHVKRCFEIAKRNRTQNRINLRLMKCLRAYSGEYEPEKLAEIRKFGGSEVYSRLTAVKCRGATSMLRDVFLGADPAWGISPTPVPSLPQDISTSITELIAQEVANMTEAGMPPSEEQLTARTQGLVDAAFQAAQKQAQEAAKRAERYLNDILTEGGFYDALAEFLCDLPIFPVAYLKGPVVTNVTEIDWVEGLATSVTKPKMQWRRVSPFDLYFSPGVNKIDDGWTVERIKYSRADLSSLIGIAGFIEEQIRRVLTDYSTGYFEWLDDYETVRAYAESKENPSVNDAEMLDGLEFNGPVRGQLLLDLNCGFTEKEIPDPILDYYVTCWFVGRYAIKVQLNPNPKKRTPYYSASFDSVPGSIVGNALSELIGDIQDVANAAFRSLVNNLSISSGPQVVVNEDRLSPTTDGNTLYPWKRWFVLSDPLGNTNAEKPVDFFQPASNAQELLGVYGQMVNMADEVSAIPRYITGSGQAQGGAASTASGLSMLMNNASKVLQNVAATIDRNILQPLLEDLYIMVMLTDGGSTLKGDESIVVKGVTRALQKETDRMRRIEFLQATANPIDMQIVGLPGRAAILRALSEDLALPGEEIVPNPEQMQQMQQAAQQAALLQQAGAQAQGNQPPKPGDEQNRLGAETDNMHRSQGPAAAAPPGGR